MRRSSTTVILREKTITPLEIVTPTVSCALEADTSVADAEVLAEYDEAGVLLGEEIEEGVARIDAAVEDDDGPGRKPDARGVRQLGAEHRMARVRVGREDRDALGGDVARDEGEHRAPPAIEADGLLDGELELVAGLADPRVSSAALGAEGARRGGAGA